MTPAVEELRAEVPIPATFRRKGNQTPTLHIHKEYGDSLYDTPVVAKDISSWVSEPFPWQKLVYRDLFMLKPDGSLQYKVVCLSVPRRNGKTEIILGLMLVSAILLKAKVLYTAQIQDTADDIYSRFMDLIENPKDPKSRLHLYFPGIQRKSKVAEEVIQAYNPRTGAPLGTLEFRGRKGQKGRGITRDVLIIDEAQDYDQGEEQRFGSINGSSEIGLTFLVGTPPPLTSKTESFSAGAAFRQVRSEAINQKDIPWEARTASKGTAWIEWGADSVKEKSDRDAWYRYNPSMGYLPKNALSEEWFENRPSTTEVFSVENLGYWTTQTRDRAIEISSFNKLAVTGEDLKLGLSSMSKYSVAIKSSREGNATAEQIHIGVAFRKDDGKISYLHTQTVVIGEDGWSHLLEALLVKLIKNTSCVSVLIDGDNAKSAVTPILIRNNLWAAGKSRVRQRKISMANLTDIAQACSTLTTVISSRQLVHSAQPPLQEAVLDAIKRPIGENGFGFKSSSGMIDIIPLEVCAMAVYGIEINAQMKTGDMGYDTSSLQTSLGAL